MIGLGCLGVPIDQVTVAAPEVAALLKFEEGHFLDLKAIEVAPSKLTKGLSAFANADGGELYVGVDETANGLVWRGFNDQEDANGHLQIFEELFPLGSEFSYEFLVSDGQSGCVLHITVQKTREIKYASDDKAYVRRGAQSLPATTPEALDRLSRAKGLTSFETQTVSVPVDFVSNSEAIIGFMLAIMPTAELASWLAKQLLIVEGKPTVAAVLLFGDEPQIALPKRSTIKIYRYKTTDSEGSRETLAFDPITIEGSSLADLRGGKEDGRDRPGDAGERA
ncbi:MAG TPA: RNA-binding domain-containing protein [Mycobacterium sp.]|nr:RNA-binding domain-containing protein [Mycobacterium sp.]